MTAARLLAARAVARAMRVREPISVSEWADANRRLSSAGSAEAGQWQTSRTPYLREIMDQLSERSPARVVAFQKCSQVGGTEVMSLISSIRAFVIFSIINSFSQNYD